MYQSYFRFKEKPFSETPDPDFLFLSQGHREGLAHLEYNIRDGKGFSVLVGEVGTGKTTLCLALRQRLDARQTDLIHLTYSDLDFTEFLQEVLEELGLPASSLQKRDLFRTLKRYVLEAHAQGRRMVILIDEAQHLRPSVLEGIRMLSNWEGPREKMIQLVFVGQPAFLEVLNRPDLLQLKQRIAGKYHLGPLTREETHGYIESRLNRVQDEALVRFTTEAKDLVYRYGRGIPRLTNFLCDFSLCHAFVAETPVVHEILVQKAYRDLIGPAGERPVFGGDGILKPAQTHEGGTVKPRAKADPRHPDGGNRGPKPSGRKLHRASLFPKTRWAAVLIFFVLFIDLFSLFYDWSGRRVPEPFEGRRLEITLPVPDEEAGRAVFSRATPQDAVKRLHPSGEPAASPREGMYR